MLPSKDLYTIHLFIYWGHYYVEISNLKNLKKKHHYRHIAISFERLFYMHKGKLRKRGQEKEKEACSYDKAQIPLFLFYNLTSGVSVVRLTSVTS